MATYPLLNNQYGIFLSESNASGNADYNIDLLYTLDREVDAGRLKRAVSQVLNSHPYVMSRLVQEESGELRLASPSEAIGPEEAVPDYDTAEALKVGMTRGFNLLDEPLFRFGMCHSPEGDILGMCFHHIVFDGISFSNFRKELSLAYDGDPLEKEEKDCFTLALEEEAARGGEVFTQQKMYYENVFAAASEVDSVPLPDMDVPDDDTIEKAVFPIGVSHGEVAQFCSVRGLGTSIPFTTAFGYLLAGFSCEQEALFATIFHGRSDKALMRSFGMMVRTFPVHVDFRQTGNIEEIMKRTSSQMKETRSRTVYSFGDCCTDLGINPQVCFAFQGPLYDYDIILGGKRQKSTDLRVARPGYTLLFNVFENVGGDYECVVQYPAGKYSDEFIRRMGLSYGQIVKEFLCRDSIADVEPADPSQKELIDSFNGPFNPVATDETLVSLFRETARRFPDNTAVIFRDRKLTYRELDELTDRAASRIHVKTVAIIINRSEQMAVCAIAAMKAGAAYQPLDPSYPEERLEFMVKDSAAGLLIADRELRPLVKGYTGDVLYTDSLDCVTDKCAPVAISPSDPYILLYTSGTTGTPKGVVLNHRNIINFCRWYREYYDLTPESVVSAYASFGFDANMMDLYPALTTGAAVCIVPEEMRLDLDSIYEYFARHGVTHCFMTTQVGFQFVSSFRTHPTLLHLTAGGEKMAPIMPPESYAFHNAYGPTECTIFTTTYRVCKYEKNIPIGRPVSNMRCSIVNRFGKTLPVGAAGELVISGPQVSPGYLNRPDKTAEVFGVYGSDSYRSGDIVRYRADGNIEFVGRKDGQVKIRGFRIELKEIEAVIREYEGIRDATVQAFSREDGTKYVVAYVVGDSSIDTHGLSRFIMERKPPYMVPEVIMQIESIPLNVNQKVDRRKLPVPERNADGASECSIREPNVLEKWLMETIEKLLSCGPVGLEGPLTGYGLSSISSMRLSAQIFKKFGVRIAGRDMLEGFSVTDVENLILTALMEKDADAAGPAASSVREGMVPLSFSQQGVYMDCMAHPDSTIYNIPMEIRFPESVSHESLAEAAGKVIEAHPVLFSHFADDKEGDVVQIVTKSRKASVQIVSTDDIEAEKSGFVRPFDLEKDMLWRAEVLRCSGMGPVLLADIHHLVTDGASFDIIIKQIISLLEGVDINPESYTYLDFCGDQKAFKDSADFKEHKEYFSVLLKDFDAVTELPQDRKSATPGRQAEVVVPVPEECLNPAPEGTTAAHLWLAASAYALGRYANTDDIYISTVSNGRQNPEVSETVGMFVNTLPVYVHIGEGSVRDYINSTASTFRDVTAHENYPFSLIAAEYGYSAGIVYACQLGVISDNRIGGSAVKADSFGLDAPKFKLCILLEEHDGSPCVVLQYDDSLYSEALMQSLAGNIVQAASNMLGHLDESIRGISLLTDGQKKILDRFHSVAGPCATVATFHQGIERWAVLKPQETAVIAADRTMTYSEFNAEANRMARVLMDRGVTRGDRVVLLLPRRSSFLTAMLAVMKCGAAYIPMDPEYPADRIAYILDDSDGKLVLTTAEKLALYEGRAMDIAEIQMSSEGLPSDNLNLDITGDDLAYMIYTSGSTGKPKGVMIQHRGITNYLTPHPANPHTYAVALESKGVVCSATVSFDLSILEYGTALYNGRLLVFADEETVTDSLRLAELYDRTGADVLSGTPSRIETYMEIPEYRDLIRRCRVIQMGGEKLPESLLQRLQEMTEARIFNMYGPTEITICCNASLMNGRQDITVGKPLPGFSEFIIDKDGNELPAGVTGELLIAGTGVCPGYYKLPEKTAASFIEWNGMRAYRSGDYASWTYDGDVKILGRTDSQVKLNGLRIELGEIESVMGRQPGVRQCVAAIRKVGRQDKLVAYYTQDAPCDPKTIKSGMAACLTYYMVPDIFVCLEDMPVLPSGKIDRRRLPEPEVRAAGYVAPRNEVETFFCDTIASVLGLDRVGVTDDFFEAGGTSLIAMRLSVACSRKGYNVAYRDIFDNSTAEKMAMLFSGNASESSPSPGRDEWSVPDYDYGRIKDVVSGNCIGTYLNDTSLEPIGTVLLTGATGYLGIHVLHELLTRTESRIYCFVRRGKFESPAMRLRRLLFYYFEDTFEEEEGRRLFVIEGDVTEPFDDPGEKIDTVINCAANVKHFSTGTDIEDTNIKGALNCVEFCLKTGAKLVHTSTGSIGGLTLEDGDKHVPPHVLMENELYFGQSLDNKYIYSKFIAERAILESIAEKGLKAKIMRLGNLSPRRSDGDFQINFKSNSYMRRLKAYNMLGAIPYSALTAQTEFSPIDDTARAIVLLAGTNDKCVIFHVINAHRELVADVIDRLNGLGMSIRGVDSQVLQQLLEEALKDPQKVDVLQSILAYSARSDNKTAVFNTYGSSYTTEVLLRMGFTWSTTTSDYIDRFLKKIYELGFFD